MGLLEQPPHCQVRIAFVRLFKHHGCCAHCVEEPSFFLLRPPVAILPSWLVPYCNLNAHSFACLAGQRVGCGG